MICDCLLKSLKYILLSKCETIIFYDYQSTECPLFVYAALKNTYFGTFRTFEINFPTYWHLHIVLIFNSLYLIKE